MRFIFTLETLASSDVSVSAVSGIAFAVVGIAISACAADGSAIACTILMC